jgi:uncharacterized membrane protein YcaP (DUF421 family)
VCAAQYANAWASANIKGADKVLEGVPTAIVRDGKLLTHGMKQERMNARDVMAHLREAGIIDIREVHLATVEDDGTVSVVLREWAQPAKRADVDQTAAKEKKTDLDGREEPTAAERTDAPRYM